LITAEKAKSYVEIQEYKEATKRTKRRKRFFDESSTPDTELTARDQLRVDVFYCIVHCLVAPDLRKRMGAYSAVHKLKKDGGKMLSTFPNVAIALRIYMTLPINNCEGERSFSTLTRL